MKIILATGCDIKYFNKSFSYLSSIQKNSNFDFNFLIFLGDEDINLLCNDDFKFNFNKIKVLTLKTKNLSTTNSFKCVQEGNFIKSDGFDNYVNNEDVIFFTDGDVTLQREISESEMDQLKNLKNNDVYIGYNFSPNDNLYDEYHRLRPTNYYSNLFSHDLKRIKCYNTGVIAMNKTTWKRLHELYTSMFSEADKMFTHYAKMQWLICFILGTNDFNIIEMGYHVHNHTHAPSPYGTKIDSNGIVTFNDKIVLFKHKWI